MKSTGSAQKSIQPPKPLFRRMETTDRRFPPQKGIASRWRIVQSMHAGRVRGAHKFH